MPVHHLWPYVQSRVFDMMGPMVCRLASPRPPWRAVFDGRMMLSRLREKEKGRARRGHELLYYVRWRGGPIGCEDYTRPAYRGSFSPMGELPPVCLC